MDSRHECGECGVTFLYDPKYHECAHKSDPVLRLQAERMRGKSWVEECMDKQYGRKG